MYSVVRAAAVVAGCWTAYHKVNMLRRRCTDESSLGGRSSWWRGYVGGGAEGCDGSGVVAATRSNTHQRRLSTEEGKDESNKRKNERWLPHHCTLHSRSNVRGKRKKKKSRRRRKRRGRSKTEGGIFKGCIRSLLFVHSVVVGRVKMYTAKNCVPTPPFRLARLIAKGEFSIRVASLLNFR